MTEPFLGEIRMVSFNFAPKGWALCNGQLLPINQNQALFSLFGTDFGGDGRTNFALPDLRDRIPIHVGNGHPLGERGGTTVETLTINQLPAHTHGLQASNSAGNVATATGNSLAGSPVYTDSSTSTTLPMLGNTGESQAHNNMQPYLVINFIVALQGIFPSQS